VFDVVMLAGYVLLRLGDPSIELGMLYHTAGSRHLYETNWEGVAACLKSDLKPVFEYTDFDPYEFKSPEDLVQHLWGLAELDKSKFKGKFLVNTIVDVYPMSRLPDDKT